ncbi:MAG: hypothetical protein AB8G17_08565 [Gammaproteobacteria bacterium]
MIDADQLARQLEAGTVDAAAFGHAEHVAAGYALLRRYPFEDAALRYARGIRSLARAAGAPDKFHMTVTLAFLSLIGERLTVTKASNFAEFAAANADLLSASCLDKWYTSARLDCPTARRTFVLPDRTASA